jgi:predicted ATPase
LKGFPDPVSVFVVEGKREFPEHTRGLEGHYSPMVGRQAETGLLMGSMANLVTNHVGGLIFVSGSAGVGKSRLIEEFLAIVPQDAVRIHEGQSYVYRRTVPYWIFRDMLGKAMGISLEMTEKQTQDLVSHYCHTHLEGEAENAIHYIRYMMELPQPDAEITRQLSQLDADTLRQRVLVAVRDLFHAEAVKHPILLILEDLHWADIASLEVLDFLLDSVSEVPLIIIAIARPSMREETIKIIDRASQQLVDHYHPIRLENLSEGESKQLLNLLLPTAEFPETFLQEILSKSAGIPFFLEEILRKFIDDDIMTSSDMKMGNGS